MTEKQKRFCDEYLIDLNGTRAYKAAYPNVKSDKAAGAASARLLGNVSIRAYLDERERLKAAELLGKRFGLFTDKLNVEGNIPVVIAGDDKIAD